MRWCVCVCVLAGGSVYREAGWEEVMQSEGVFAWKCEQWTDALFFTPPTPTHIHTHIHPSPTLTPANTHPSLGE